MRTPKNVHYSLDGGATWHHADDVRVCYRCAPVGREPAVLQVTCTPDAVETRVIGRQHRAFMKRTTKPATLARAVRRGRH